ncbi:MAG: hypothetical protein ACRD6R_04470 [Candidatus Polarisedimenticolia bacterium]
MAPAGAPRVREEAGACILEAPAALEAALRELAARARVLLPRLESRLGVRAAAPYRIVLIPARRGENRADPEIEALDAAAPPWASGFLIPARRTGALRLALADRYPHSDAASVLVHEAAHMLLHDAVAGDMPRWFGEGVATGFEREWGLRDILVYSTSLLTGRLPPLGDLDGAFGASAPQARVAYAASFDFVRFTRRRHGAWIVRDIVREAGGRSFGEAWEAATGEPLERTEEAWRRDSLLLYRWVPALTGTGSLWAVITVLAFAAFARRRARVRAIRERWEMEEGPERDEGPPGDGSTMEEPDTR